MTAAITSKDLTFEYGPGVGAVGLNLSVRTGTVYGFLGPNGAGKSTAIRMLTSLIRPQRGTLSVLGLDPWEDAPELHKKLGVLISDQPAPRHHTGASLLALLAKLRKNPGVVRQGQLLAERLSLDLSKKGHQLSLGNRQKLGLVTALAHDPDMVILDEPTNGLDPLLQREISHILREMADRGKTVMLSSHQLPDVEAIADDIGFIKDAKLVEQLSLATLADRAIRRVSLTFETTPERESFNNVEGVERVAIDDAGQVTVEYRGAVAGLLSRAGELGALQISADPADLEATFLAMYSTEPATGSGPDSVPNGELP